MRSVLSNDLQKHFKTVLINDGLALGGSSAGDVGEGPSCLQLQLRELLLAHQFQQNWHTTQIDDFLHKLKVLASRYNSPQANDRPVSLCQIGMH